VDGGTKIATASGSVPTVMLPITVFVEVSMIEMVPEF